jgi:hypothetical protein
LLPWRPQVTFVQQAVDTEGEKEIIYETSILQEEKQEQV